MFNQTLNENVSLYTMRVLIDLQRKCKSIDIFACESVCDKESKHKHKFSVNFSFKLIKNAFKNHNKHRVYQFY